MRNDLNDAAARLAAFMKEIAGETFTAGFVGGLEHELWLAVCDEPRGFGDAYLRDEHVEELRRLSDAAGGWIALDEADDPTFVPLADWRGRFAAWKATRPPWRSPQARALLDSDPGAALAWFASALAAAPTLPARFNWHGLAEVAASSAIGHNDDRAKADACAHIATIVYARLAAETPGAYRAELFELSAMNGRVVMIRRWGHSEGHPVRDLAQIVAWFHERCELPLEQARAEVDRLRAPGAAWADELPTLRTLRTIKNRLTVFRSLDPPPAELASWLELWPRLP